MPALEVAAVGDLNGEALQLMQRLLERVVLVADFPVEFLDEGHI
jgi:hypothetical protein